MNIYEHENLHFDNEQHTYTSSKNHYKSNCNLDLDLANHLALTMCSISKEKVDYSGKTPLPYTSCTQKHSRGKYKPKDQGSEIST